jgi:hypothetical protein
VPAKSARGGAGKVGYRPVSAARKWIPKCLHRALS